MSDTLRPGLKRLWIDEEALVELADVFCDGKGKNCCGWCSRGQFISGPKRDARAARKNARFCGWSITRDGDFCPACAKERKAVFSVTPKGGAPNA